MYAVALRMVGNGEDARDLAQTAFLKAYEKLHTFDPRYRFFSWLYRILKNESLNFLARRHPDQPFDRQVGLRAPDDPQRDAERGEQAQRIQTALAQLSADHREVLLLRHWAELSYEEMAVALKIPEKTVKSRLYSARQRLGELLGEGGAGRRTGHGA